MIVLVGVGHVFDIAAQVRKIILHERPAAVCVELDPYRFESLRNPEATRTVPITYRILAEVQKRMAKEFGGEVGGEMIAAIEAAKDIGASVEFIDEDATMVFQKLWREMPVKEKITLMFSAITGIFVAKGRIEKELEKFQESEEEYFNYLARELPTLKKILIDDRDRIMAERIERADARYGSVVAVIGEGHINGIKKHLGRVDIKVFRLSDLRDWSSKGSRLLTESNAEATVQFVSSEYNL